MSLGSCKHHAVRHRYAIWIESRCLQRCRPIQIYNLPLFHDRNGSPCVVLASLLGHALEYLKQREGRDKQRPCRFNWLREYRRVGSVGEVLLPAR